MLFRSEVDRVLKYHSFLIITTDDKKFLKIFSILSFYLQEWTIIPPLWQNTHILNVLDPLLNYPVY